MSHHWVHLIHAAGHVVQHLARHGRKHEQAPAAPPQCSRCTSTTDIGATNCCNVRLCPSCVQAWATATLRNGSVCVICSKAAVRKV
jgi:hypothetical protein